MLRRRMLDSLRELRQREQLKAEVAAQEQGKVETIALLAIGNTEARDPLSSELKDSFRLVTTVDHIGGPQNSSMYH